MVDIGQLLGLEQICFYLCREGLRHHAGAHQTHSIITDYAKWRDSSLQSQFTTYFDASTVCSKRVIDFGCGSGDLSRFICHLGAKSVIGIDLQEKFLAIAREAVAVKDIQDRVSFLQGQPKTIPLPDACADVILCFDVMEHVLEYEAIVSEWRRVLVMGGKVLIVWGLWMHPYGHHCYPLVNLPWAHLVLSDASVLRVCARLYDRPEYVPSFWHLDDRGRKKQNPFIDDHTFEDYLNKLTTWKFERIAHRSGFRIARKKVEPFSGNRLKIMKRFLARIPFLSDAFCGCVVYELQAT